MSEFYYVGRSGEPGDTSKLEKIFDDEYDATSFASENMIDYPVFNVTDEYGDVIYSDKLAQSENDATLDDMFPEGEDD